jgi:large subunit ribosomal protein L31
MPWPCPRPTKAVNWLILPKHFVQGPHFLQGRIYVQGLTTMKKDIHPEYYETKVSCGCGNKFTTRSTRKELKVDICNVCHPFFTGKLKFIDTAGRIEKFKNKFAAAGYASLGRGKKKEPAAAAPKS